MRKIILWLRKQLTIVLGTAVRSQKYTTIIITIMKYLVIVMPAG